MKTAVISVLTLLAASSALAFGKKPSSYTPPAPFELTSDASISVQCVEKTKYNDGSSEAISEKPPVVVSFSSLEAPVTVFSGQSTFDPSTQILLSAKELSPTHFVLILNRSADDEAVCSSGLPTSDQFEFFDESTTSIELHQSGGHWYMYLNSFVYEYMAKKIRLTNKCGRVESPTAPVGTVASKQITCTLR